MKPSYIHTHTHIYMYKYKEQLRWWRHNIWLHTRVYCVVTREERKGWKIFLPRSPYSNFTIKFRFNRVIIFTKFAEIKFEWVVLHKFQYNNSSNLFRTWRRRSHDAQQLFASVANLYAADTRGVDTHPPTQCCSVVYRGCMPSHFSLPRLLYSYSLFLSLSLFSTSHSTPILS